MYLLTASSSVLNASLLAPRSSSTSGGSCSIVLSSSFSAAQPKKSKNIIIHATYSSVLTRQTGKTNEAQ